MRRLAMAAVAAAALGAPWGAGVAQGPPECTSPAPGQPGCIWAGRSPSGQAIRTNVPPGTVGDSTVTPATVHRHPWPIGHGNGRICDDYESNATPRDIHHPGPRTARSTWAPSRGWTAGRIGSASQWRDAPAHGGWTDGRSDRPNASSGASCGSITRPVTVTRLGNIHWYPCPTMYWRDTANPLGEGGPCVRVPCPTYYSWTPTACRLTSCPSGYSLTTNCSGRRSPCCRG